MSKPSLEIEREKERGKLEKERNTYFGEIEDFIYLYGSKASLKQLRNKGRGEKERKF